MSAGYGGRGSSYSRGGSSKKVRRKKQEYHEHRYHSPEAGSPGDQGTLKDRTLRSLDRLGHQAFVPGSGYGMENWMKSLNFLLEDFEARAAEELTLPESYLARRSEVLTALSKPPEAPELDAEIAGAREAEVKVLKALGNREASYFGSTRSDLNRRKDGVSAELDAERAAIAKIKAQPRPNRLFQRFLGEKPPSTAGKEANAARLEKEVAEIDAEIAALEAEEFLFDEGRRQLEVARDNLSKLEARKAERLQFSVEREAAAKALAEEIGKLPLPGGEEGQRV